MQITKDFRLAGIELKIKGSVKNESLETLALEIEGVLTAKNISQICYIVDLSTPFEDNLGLRIIHRVAFKVYLKMHLSL